MSEETSALAYAIKVLLDCRKHLDGRDAALYERVSIALERLGDVAK